MKTLLLSGLFLLCCAAAADCAVAEAVTELDDLPERAVFEVRRVAVGFVSQPPTVTLQP